MTQVPGGVGIREKDEERTRSPPLGAHAPWSTFLPRAPGAGATKHLNKWKPREQPERSRHLGRLPGGDATKLALGQVAAVLAAQAGTPLQIPTADGPVMPAGHASPQLPASLTPPTLFTEKRRSDPAVKLRADTPAHAPRQPQAKGTAHLPCCSQSDRLVWNDLLLGGSPPHGPHVWGLEGESSILIQKYQMSQRASCQHSPATRVSQPPASTPDHGAGAEGSVRDKAGTRSVLRGR